MPESRDRLARPVDIETVFSRRRSGTPGILQDESEAGGSTSTGTPIRQEFTPVQATHEPLGLGAARRGQGLTPTGATREPMGLGGTTGGGLGRARLGTPRSVVGRSRNLYGSPGVGRENIPFGTARRGRGRASNSVLPSWYPRTPLRDITAVVRAIERRRARLREVEGQQTEITLYHDEGVLDSSVMLSGAQLEHKISMSSPNPTLAIKQTSSVGKLSKILLDATKQSAGESEILTPQKKLLNSIDTVEKAVMEELRKQKRTPSAKKAEREKRVRTLMSMR